MLKDYYLICCLLLGFLISQLSKPLFALIKVKHFDWRLIFDSGRFPSSHTSCVFSLLTGIFIQDGIKSSSFAITLCYTIIVCYDAINIRYYGGKHIELTKQLISDMSKEIKLDTSNEIYQAKLKTVLGHNFIEMVCGGIVGIIIAVLLYLLRG